MRRMSPIRAIRNKMMKLLSKTCTMRLQVTILKDLELVRKDKYHDAVGKFNDLINESEKAGAHEWICKSLTNILMIRCKENSSEVLSTLARLMQSIDRVPKKDAETAVKSAIDYVMLRSDVG